VLVNYWLLAFALILLWLPRPWLRAGASVIPTPRLRRRAVKDHDSDDLSLRWRDEFFKFRNWIDLLRGAVGGWGVVYMCMETPDNATLRIQAWGLVLKVLVLLVAVLVQTVRRERSEFKLVAPVFFVMGLGIGLVGFLAALFAIVMAWTLNRALSSAGMFLCVFAGLLVCFAYVVNADSLAYGLIGAGLAWVPVLLSALTRRRLDRVSRASSFGR
jgi:hypothetical protein